MMKIKKNAIKKKKKMRKNGREKKTKMNVNILSPQSKYTL